MKLTTAVRLLPGLLLFLLGTLPVSAASVNLDWFRNPEPDVTNYKIYYGTVTGQYTSSANAGNNTNITISGLAEGQTYFFAATAINAAGLESKPSEEISYVVPGGGSVPGSNSPPAITAPASFTAPKNTATTIPGISLSDPDAGSANVSVVISASRGIISVLTDVPDGITAGQVAFNRSANVQISASIAAINTTFTAANGIVYTGHLNLIGPDVVNLSVNDNGNTGEGGAQSTSRQITANVTGDSVDSWRNICFNAADLIDPTKVTLWGDDADPDEDAFVNLQEYGLGRDPLLREAGTNGLFSSTVLIEGQSYNTLTFTMRKNETTIQYTVEVSADNTTWNSGPSYVILANSTDLSPNLQSVTYRDVAPATQTRAIRLRITR